MIILRTLNLLSRRIAWTEWSIYIQQVITYVQMSSGVSGNVSNIRSLSRVYHKALRHYLTSRPPHNPVPSSCLHSHLENIYLLYLYSNICTNNNYSHLNRLITPLPTNTNTHILNFYTHKEKRLAYLKNHPISFEAWTSKFLFIPLSTREQKHVCTIYIPTWFPIQQRGQTVLKSDCIFWITLCICTYSLDNK